MRVLFFTPFAGRTGSEVALFNLVRRAAARGWEVGVVCRTLGAQLQELPPRVPVFVYQNWHRLWRAYADASRWFSPDADRFLSAAHDKFGPDVWYVNTVLLPEVVRQARLRNVPCVLHTHELEQELEGLTERDTETLVRYPRLVVACSEKARDVFRVLGRRDGLEVCYETIDPTRIIWNPERSREVRRTLGAREGTFVWAMSGWADPNKNTARFVEVAAEMLREGPDARFMWVGNVSGGYGLYVRGRARELGVAERVSFIGERAGDYYDYLNAADGLVVTSFKESFSIAAAEAAYLGKPVVSFDCGGISEVIREGMGVVLDSWNTPDLVGAMRAVMRDGVGFDPKASRERVREFYVDVQGARWEDFMRQYFEG